MSLTRFIALCIVIGATLSACVNLPSITSNPTSPIRTIAVLPMINNSTDVEGTKYVRQEIAAQLPKHYYIVKPPADVDQILKDRMGITLGAQLDMTTPKQLGEALGVDGVIFSALDDFSHNVTGVYNVKRVRLRAKLVNCKTGETLWKNGAGVKTASGAGGLGSVASMGSSSSDKSESEDLKPLLGDTVAAPWQTISESSSGGNSLAGIGISMAAGLIEKVASKAIGTPLKQETESAVRIVLNGYYHDGGMFGSPKSYGAGIPSGSSGSATEVYAGVMPAMIPFDMVAGSMFNYAFNVNGYWLGNKTYKPGEWTRWQVTAKEEKEKHEMEKAYLKKESDGKEWWRVAFVEGANGATFEGQFTAGPAELLRLRGRFAANEQPNEFPVTKSQVYKQPKHVDAAGLKNAFVKKDTVTVPAGTFKCDYYLYSPTPSEVSEWWISDQVPGGVVKYLFREGKGAQPRYEMTLNKFGKDATTVLASY